MKLFKKAGEAEKNTEGIVLQEMSEESGSVKEKVKKPKEKKTASYSKLSSIQVKVTALVLGGIVIAASIVAYSMITYTKSLIVDAAYGRMVNEAGAYGALVGEAEENNSKKVISAEEYAEILKDFKVEGSESSYCFVVDKAGIIRYHRDETMIGKPNQNEFVTGLVGKMNKNAVATGSMCMEYEEDGRVKYASYYLTPIKSILVICADAEELMASANALVYRVIALILAILAIALVVTFIVVKGFTKPLGQVIHIINDTAKLKLQLPENMDKLCERRDETGVMSRAVKDMGVSLHEVVEKIEQSNSNIQSNMEQLEASSNAVHINCSDNSATTRELVESTQEIENMTEFMTNHVNEMRNQFEAIQKETAASRESSLEIAGRAGKMQESTQQAIRQTRSMYEQIKSKTDQAIEGLKAVSKINELTGAIMEISDQTDLLSLNASIEAARAGDAGKGFAVVASEISTLAQRTLDTVADIDSITAEINVAVNNISSSIEEITSFLEDSVLADYDNFNRISSQYMKDADTFREGMESISRENDIMNASIVEVAGTVERIQATIEETAGGIGDIADKTSSVVESTSANYKLTSDTVESVNRLKEIVGKFEF